MQLDKRGAIAIAIVLAVLLFLAASTDTGRWIIMTMLAGSG